MNIRASKVAYVQCVVSSLGLSIVSFIGLVQVNSEHARVPLGVTEGALGKLTSQYAAGQTAASRESGA